MSGSAEFFNEMREPDGSVRSPYSGYCEWYDGQDKKLLQRKHTEAETNFRKTGITFNVYGEDEAEERLIPFDMVPRIIDAKEWRKLTRGIEQRVSRAQCIHARSLSPAGNRARRSSSRKAFET